MKFKRKNPKLLQLSTFTSFATKNMYHTQVNVKFKISKLTTTKKDSGNENAQKIFANKKEFDHIICTKKFH